MDKARFTSVSARVLVDFGEDDERDEDLGWFINEQYYEDAAEEYALEFFQDITSAWGVLSLETKVDILSVGDLGVTVAVSIAPGVPVPSAPPSA